MRDLKQELINWQGRKVLMVIYPHPDDETMGAGGLLQVAKSLGWKTIVIILTHGEAGQMHIHPHGRTTKEVRDQELKTAVQILQVDKLVQGDFGDGQLKPQKQLWSVWLTKVIAKHNPGWIVTYDHSGISGHPDHICLSLVLRNVPAKLYWTSFPLDLKFGNSKVHAWRSAPTHKLSLGKWGNLKLKAMKTHRSQKLSSNIVLYQTEWYHEVEAKRAYPYKYVEFKI